MKVRLLEADITKTCISFLKAHGWRAVRMQSGLFTNGRNMITVGEKGMKDWLLVYYLDNGVALLIWVEMKQLGSSEACRCKPASIGKRASECTACAQKRWAHEEEVFSRGRAVQITIRNFDEFRTWYEGRYAWLRKKQTGQLLLEEDKS